MRQLRLRDIGGIIVIDFIDMANPKNRQLVEDALEAELARDRTKTYVVEISPLGLVEMTRQNVTDGPREILTDKCPTCEATGVVVSAETRAVEVERKLRREVAGSKAEAFQVELHSDVAAILVGPNGEHLEELEKETGKRFAFKTKKSFRLDRFAILAAGQGRRDRRPGAQARARRGGTRARKAAAAAVVALDETLIEGVEEAPEAEAGGSRGGAPPTATSPRRSRRRRPAAARVEAAAARRRPRAETTAKPRGRGDEAAEPSAAEPVEAARGRRGCGWPSPNGDAPAEEKPKKKTRRGTRGGPPAEEEAGGGETPPSRLRPRRTLARLSAAAGPARSFPVYEP